MNEKFTRGGVFSVTPKRKMHGMLTLDGENSSLELWDIDNKKRPIEGDHLGDKTTIEGILDNQKRVSLIDCLYHGPSTYGSAEGASHHHSFFPHFAVVGGPVLTERYAEPPSQSMIRKPCSMTNDPLDTYPLVRRICENCCVRLASPSKMTHIQSSITGQEKRKSFQRKLRWEESP